LATRFNECARGRALVEMQQSFVLFDDGEPVPDIMLLRPQADRRRIPTAADVLLVVEVADTTLRHDRVTKAARYAAARVPEYWIYVVPGAERDRPVIVVHRQPGPQGYVDVRSSGRGAP